MRALDLDQALCIGVPQGCADPHGWSARQRAVNVQDIMSSRVGTVEMDDKLKVVKEIVDTVKFHHLLVVEEGKLFGVVSDRDLLRGGHRQLARCAEVLGSARGRARRRGP